MATRKQLVFGAQQLVVGAQSSAAAIIFGGRYGALRSPSYSFGALSQATHDELLSILRAALLSSGGEGASAMSDGAAAAQGGGDVSNLGGGQTYADWRKQQAAEKALLAKVATTSASQILQKSKASQALDMLRS